MFIVCPTGAEQYDRTSYTGKGCSIDAACCFCCLMCTFTVRNPLKPYNKKVKTGIVAILQMYRWRAASRHRTCSWRRPGHLGWRQGTAWWWRMPPLASRSAHGPSMSRLNLFVSDVYLAAPWVLRWAAGDCLVLEDAPTGVQVSPIHDPVSVLERMGPALSSCTSHEPIL